MDKLLPIGSIIQTNEYESKLMIIGKTVEKDNKIYDYSCVIYPFGFLMNIDSIYINTTDIKRVVFLGNTNY